MEKQITLLNKTIHVVFIQWTKVNQHKPILIFLHEALGSVGQWRGFPEQLCSKLGCAGIIIERTGHGKSSELVEKRNKDYLHKYAHETNQVIGELLEITNSYILVGHSDGGSIALIHASLNKRNHIGTFIMAAHTFVEPITILSVQKAAFLLSEDYLEKFARFHGEKSKKLIDAWRDTWLSNDFQSWDIREEIKSCKQPIFAIQGELDEYGSQLQLESILKIGKNIEIKTIPNSGHHPHLTDTKIIIHDFQNWYSKHF